MIRFFLYSKSHISGRAFPASGGAGDGFLAATLLPPLLAACAAFAPPPPKPPLPYPPSARERMLRIALAEWEDWGRRERTPGAYAAAPSPGRAPAETDPANFPRVLAYWRALEDDGGAVSRNRPLYAAALAGTADLEVLGPSAGRWLVRAADHRILCDTLASTPRPAGRLRVEVDPLRA